MRITRIEFPSSSLLFFGKDNFMGALIDIGGQRFGRLVVLKKIGGGSGKNSEWLCRCDCGKQKSADSKSLRTGLTQSCGCLRRETTAVRGQNNFKDHTGKIFGRLTVIDRQAGPSGRALWRCRCDCGNITIVASSNLGRTVSCGCYASEVHAISIKRRSTTHGKSRTKEYVAWVAMRSRCEISNNDKNHKYHGGRGIKVCKRWHKFENFLADMGECPPDKDSIDRYPDKDGDYELSNCRWATWKEQASNRNKAGYLRATLSSGS
jgi:hypothetical protein